MNRQILNHYIQEYKLHFNRVNHYEIYKWKAIKCFQDNWEIEASNFHAMLVASFAMTKNLMVSGSYFPLRMLVQYAEHNPNEVRELFRSLYDEEEGLYQRIADFKNGINAINNHLFENKSSYQDSRAIIVYLTLRYPERYLFYKFKMFKKFSAILELTYKPIAGRIENIGHFNSISELIRHEISLDQELLRLHKNRLSNDCYYDENLYVLTQDFIYAVTMHLEHHSAIPTQDVYDSKVSNVLSSDLTRFSEQVTFQGKVVNFIQNGIENKRLGDLGELWVMEYEREKLRRANRKNLIEKIKHIAKDEGDGTGFDIQSFDSNGGKMFIEVKTTKGNKNDVFYVTRNELERSILEKGNYYVYRLYNFDEKKGRADLLIIKGELTKLCAFPTIYKINLSKN